jgi:hypothetical protein
MFSFVWAYGLLAPRRYQIVDGVMAIRLAGGCEIEYFRKGTQPVNTLVLACPRTEAIFLVLSSKKC